MKCVNRRRVSRTKAFNSSFSLLPSSFFRNFSLVFFTSRPFQLKHHDDDDKADAEAELLLHLLPPLMLLLLLDASFFIAFSRRPSFSPPSCKAARWQANERTVGHAGNCSRRPSSCPLLHHIVVSLPRKRVKFEDEDVLDLFFPDDSSSSSSPSLGVAEVDGSVRADTIAVEVAISLQQGQTHGGQSTHLSSLQLAIEHRDSLTTGGETKGELIGCQLAVELGDS